MTQHTQGPWYQKDHVNGKTYIYPKSGLNPICEIFEGYKDNQDLIAAAPELLQKLNEVQQWLWLELLDPDKPINRDSAAKCLEQINKLINPLLVE